MRLNLFAVPIILPIRSEAQIYYIIEAIGPLSHTYSNYITEGTGPLIITTHGITEDAIPSGVKPEAL